MPKMRGKLSAVVLILALVTGMILPTGALGASPGTTTLRTPFWDVVATQWEEAVGALYDLQVVDGTGPNTFSPKNPVTRAQMAALLVRALGMGVAKPTKAAPFTDVTGHWAANAIGVASEQNLIRGVATDRFAPEDPVTYEQASAMLIRALGYEGQVQGAYPTGYVLLASQLGLLADTKFAIGEEAPRGDIALMLYHAIFEVENPVSHLTLSQLVFKKAVSLEVVPGEGQVTQGAVKLTAVGKDIAGKNIELPVKWQVISGDAIVDPDGTLTVTGTGDITVRAQAGDLIRTVAYRVIKSLAVTSPTYSVKPGQTVKLTATGSLADGTKLTVQPTWTVISGPASVDAQGNVTVNGSGAITVEASVGKLTARVDLASAAGITVTPSSKLITPGQTVQFTANVTDASGKTITAPVTWTVVSGDGRIDSNGLFTATGNRGATVQAAVGDLKATASVQVLARIDVTPGTLDIGKAEVKQFSATGVTGDNQTVPVAVTWSTQGPIGIIDPTGKFISTGPGTGKVVAEYQGLRGEVPVTIAGDPVAIQVSMDRQNIVANGASKVTVTATLVDINGVKAKGNIQSINFVLNTPIVGSLSATAAPVVDGQAQVAFTPSNQVGTGVITASAPGGLRPGMYTFTTNAPSLARVRLSAYPNPLAADGVSESEITATLIDQDGQPYRNVSGNVYPIMLSTSTSAAGNLTSVMVSVPTGLTSASVKFRASGTVASTVISGSALAPVDPVTVSTTLVGPATGLYIRRDTAPAKADGVSEMAIKVEIRDANGNVRTADNGTSIYVTATNGDQSITLSGTSTVNGVSTVKFKTTRAGTWTLRAYSNIGSLQSDTADVQFTAGAAARLQLSVDPTAVIAADGISKVNLVAKVVDANNNLVSSATDPVTFAKVQDKQVTTMPDQKTVYATEGIATLTLTSTPWTGTETFKATSVNLTESNTVDVTSQIVGVPVKAEVYSVTNAPVGGTATVKVRIVDYSGKVVTSSNGLMVALTSNSNTAVINSPQPTTNGVATFTVSNQYSGTIVLTASAAGLQADNGTKSVTFAAGLADHIVLSASPSVLAADGISRTQITGKIVDAFGNSVGGGQSVTLSMSTTGVGTLTNNYMFTNGGSSWFTAGTTPGTVVISGVASNGMRVDPVTIQTVSVGNPARVVVDPPTSAPAGTGAASQIQVRVRVVDTNGNTVTSLNTGNTLSAAGLVVQGSSGTGNTAISVTNTTGLAAVGFIANGQNTGAAAINSGVATFIFSNQRAETVTLTPMVYYNGQRLDVVPAQVTTTSGLAQQLLLTMAPTALSSEYQDRGTLRVTLADSYGNAVASQSDTVTLTLSSSDYISVPTNTLTLTNGSAEVTVYSLPRTSGGSTVITATSARTGLSRAITVTTDVAPSKPTNIWAADQGGDDTRITLTDLAVKVSFRMSGRATEQQVWVYVNGVSVPVYTSTQFTTTVTTVGANATSFVGYIKLSDLGGYGVKEIRAAVSSGLGMSPMSDPTYVTYQAQ